MQSEHNRLVGQQAELQRRLGETELRADLNCKAAEQEATASRTECEFLRRKIGLLEKETETLKQDYERTIKDLEQRNMEVNSREAYPLCKHELCGTIRQRDAFVYLCQLGKLSDGG